MAIVADSKTKLPTWKKNQLKQACAVLAICGSLCLPQSKAAQPTFTWSPPVEVANTSTKALNDKAFTDQTGNREPSIQFEVITAGLPAGTYITSYVDTSLPAGGKAFYRVFRK
ncbi:MAG: hypothetical protein H8M99_07020 [Gloeobacteraceae cyanobacterium ES-bin-144]|nr:hypothetical protein [Verrucomicrobiales bacterium]